MENVVTKINNKFPELEKFSVRNLFFPDKAFKRYKPYSELPVRSLAYAERVVPVHLDYVLTEHANDRLYSRYLSEKDVINTINLGVKNTGVDTYIFEYKYIRVVIASEKYDATGEAVVITVMFDYAFLNVLNRCIKKFVSVKRSMLNALRYVYDEIGDAMYKHSKKVDALLSEYGFVKREDVFGNSLNLFETNRKIELGKKEKKSIDLIRRTIPSSVIGKSDKDGLLRMMHKNVGNRLVTRRYGDHTYVFDTKLINFKGSVTYNFNELNNVLSEVLKNRDDMIHLNDNDVHLFRDARYEIVVMSLGSLYWIVSLHEHVYYKEFMATYMKYCFSSSCRTYLNRYVNTMGLYLYTPHRAKDKHRYLIGMMAEMNNTRLQWSIEHMKRVLEKEKVSIG